MRLEDLDPKEVAQLIKKLTIERKLSPDEVFDLFLFFQDYGAMPFLNRDPVHNFRPYKWSQAYLPRFTREDYVKVLAFLYNAVIDGIYIEAIVYDKNGKRKELSKEKPEVLTYNGRQYYIFRGDPTDDFFWRKLHCPKRSFATFYEIFQELHQLGIIEAIYCDYDAIVDIFWERVGFTFNDIFYKEYFEEVVKKAEEFKNKEREFINEVK